MKKKVLFGVVLVLILSLTAPAWDVLGHAFIMEQIKGGPQNANGNELYGITSPDFVNYLLNTPYYDFLYGATHKDFMRVWNMATTPAAQSLAMGFVAHNGLWGADYIAHVSSLTTDPTNGYVINKAIDGGRALCPIGHLGHDGTRAATEYAGFRRELCHNIVEYVDRHPGLDGRPDDRRPRQGGGARTQRPIMQHLVKTAFGGPLVAFSQKTAARLNHPAALAILLPAETAFQERVAITPICTPRRLRSNRSSAIWTAICSSWPNRCSTWTFRPVRQLSFWEPSCDGPDRRRRRTSSGPRSPTSKISSPPTTSSTARAASRPGTGRRAGSANRDGRTSIARKSVKESRRTGARRSGAPVLHFSRSACPRLDPNGVKPTPF